MYEAVKTGPLYDKAVQSMSTYRSVAARMGGAKASTQGKLDRRLERLQESIAERLSELSVQERSALNCWKDSILPGTYELNHDAITAQPYVSIRRIDRWDEEYDVAERRAQLRGKSTTPEPIDPKSSEQLRKFLNNLGDNDDL